MVKKPEILKMPQLPVARSDTVDILGQVVTGVGEQFQT